MFKVVYEFWIVENGGVTLDGLCISLVYFKNKYKENFESYEQRNTYKCCLTGNTFSSARRSKGEVVRSRPASPGDKCLFCGF